MNTMMTDTKRSMMTVNMTRIAMTATRNMPKAWMMPWMNSKKMVKCIKTKKNVA